MWDFGELSERARKILGAVVREFIDTAEPVSSRTLVARHFRELSSATIRNEMAELEAAGFLKQPHKSAGRVPTEKSFRFYVDSLLKPRGPFEYDTRRIKKALLHNRPADETVRETLKVLTGLTSCAGFVLVPRASRFVIRHIKCLKLNSEQMMVVIVSQSGLLQSRVIVMDDALRRLDFEKVSNYLSSIAEGLDYRELRKRLLDEMRSERSLYNDLLGNALRLSDAVFDDGGASDPDAIIFEGKTNVFEQPEFRRDVERMRELYDAFEEKSLLVKIIDKSMDEAGIHIFMGSESEVKEFEGLGFVTAPYTRDGDIIGTLGVVGPMRMDYSKIVPLVDFTACTLGKVF
ncbi:MAG TPA: heat-inducible transcription repressor HrcA [Deltaproteobacteria bacterium]|nr:heat-inducible transcription repressor HrcA [Deltaproteobacteria bacterium]